MMTSTQFQDVIYVADAFRLGKLEALQILYKEYLEAQLHGVRSVPIQELLNTLRTLTLNLEESKGES